MILPHEQDVTERYFFLSKVSNGAGKNEFISKFICLQPHLYEKIHTSHTHINTRKWQLTFLLAVAYTQWVF